jgi:hypothetical protein
MMFGRRLNKLGSAIKSLPPQAAFNFSLAGQAFDERITYTGASARMRFDSTGTLRYAPMNLLTYSEQFDNAAWVNQGSSETLAVIDPPSGCAQSWVLDDGVNTSGHDIGQNATTVAAMPYTVTVRFKNNDRRYAIVACSASTTSWASAKFDLQDGVVGSISQSGAGWSATSSSITADTVAGWYICTLTFVSGTTGTVTARVGMATDATTFTASLRGLESYTGTNKQLYATGAQVSQGSEVFSYIPTTTAAVYLPRSNAYQDHDPSTLAPLGFLIEEQRTNSIRNNTMQGAVAGVIGSGGAIPTNWAFTVNTTTGLTREVVSIATDNGIPRIRLRLSGTAVGAGSFAINFDTNTAMTAAVNSVWTLSMYRRLQAGSFAGLTPANGMFLLSYNAAGSGSHASTSQVRSEPVATSAALNTQRITLTGTLSNALTERVNGGLFWAIADGAAIDITLDIGLPQLELGAFATSPILTTGAAATRLADVASITGTNFSSFWNQAEGTVVARGDSIVGTQATSRFVWSAYADASNRIETLISTAQTAFSRVVNAGTPDSIGSSVATPLDFKIATAIRASDGAVSVNGSTATTDTGITLPTPIAVGLGYAGYTSSGWLNGHLQSLTYYAKRLPNNVLQSLTV